MTIDAIEVVPPNDIATLIRKAKALVELLEDAENNHGGLIGTTTLRAKNELRLELSKW